MRKPKFHKIPKKYFCVNLIVFVLDSNDGERFFGEANFLIDEWMESLNYIANRSKGLPNVVGLGLRNEVFCFRLEKYLRHIKKPYSNELALNKLMGRAVNINIHPGRSMVQVNMILF